MDCQVFSTKLLRLPDRQLRTQWDRAADRRYSGEPGWTTSLYSAAFVGRQALELWSGLGYDVLRFAVAGSTWTFADFAPDNLALVERVATLKGLRSQVRFHVIDHSFGFAGLGRDYDAIWACSSLNHIPFEAARVEALAALRLLKPRSRWIELAYPRRHWLRQGRQDFADWGGCTDGERTPWVEWYDAETIRHRLSPAPQRAILDFEFSGGNYVWWDFEFDSELPYHALNRNEAAPYQRIRLDSDAVQLVPGATRRLLKRARYVTPRGLFAPTAAIALNLNDLGMMVG